MNRGNFCAAMMVVAAILLMVVPAQAQIDILSEAKPSTEKATGIFSYAVKFVCGFNRSNLGISADGQFNSGEATVKAGNYATDVNIFNPSLSPNDVAQIRKKVIFLVKDGFPVGREPEFAGPAGEDGILLPGCHATFDDCNKILDIGQCPVVPGAIPALSIGFLVIQSPIELDVTAVYTAEICTDFVINGAEGMCQSAAGGIGAGAGISIDVEQIESKFFP